MLSYDDYGFYYWIDPPTVQDPNIQSQLLHALENNKPFHNFNTALLRHTETPRQWHAFRDAAMKVRAVQ